jgi:hypothetical protein
MPLQACVSDGNSRRLGRLGAQTVSCASLLPHAQGPPVPNTPSQLQMEEVPTQLVSGTLAFERSSHEVHGDIVCAHPCEVEQLHAYDNANRCLSGCMNIATTNSSLES